MNKIVEDTLVEYGLDNKEAKVYLSVLSLGSTSVTKISKNSTINRTNCYDILEKLSKKGLVSFSLRSGKKFYSGSHPSQLINSLKDKETKIKRILPLLLSSVNSLQNLPTIEIYEGKESIKNIFEDMLKTDEDILAYGNAITIINMLQYYFPRFIKKRIKKKIKIKIIIEKSKQSVDLRNRDKKELRKTKFLDKRYHFPTFTYVYGEKIAIISLFEKNIIGVLIKDENIALTQKNVFNILWSVAK